MDAFSVSICKGLSKQKLSVVNYLQVGLWFGLFQGIMPVIGYLFGTTFKQQIESIDHWIAFVILAIIGANMIVDGCSKKKETEDDKKKDSDFSFKTMLLLAIATSIDALAAGISIALSSDTNVYLAGGTIAGITMVTSMIGLKIGNIFGAKFKNGALIAGGVALILIGIKIVLQHLGIISF